MLILQAYIHTFLPFGCSPSWSLSPEVLTSAGASHGVLCGIHSMVHTLWRFPSGHLALSAIMCPSFHLGDWNPQLQLTPQNNTPQTSSAEYKELGEVAIHLNSLSAIASWPRRHSTGRAFSAILGDQAHVSAVLQFPLSLHGVSMEILSSSPCWGPGGGELLPPEKPGSLEP